MSPIKRKYFSLLKRNINMPNMTQVQIAACCLLKQMSTLSSLSPAHRPYIYFVFCFFTVVSFFKENDKFCFVFVELEEITPGPAFTSLDAHS